MKISELPNRKVFNRILSTIEKEVTFQKIKWKYSDSDESEYADFEIELSVDNWSILVEGHISWTYNCVINQEVTDYGSHYVNDSYISDEELVVDKITIYNNNNDVEFIIQ